MSSSVYTHTIHNHREPVTLSNSGILPAMSNKPCQNGKVLQKQTLNLSKEYLVKILSPFGWEVVIETSLEETQLHKYAHLQGLRSQTIAAGAQNILLKLDCWLLSIRLHLWLEMTRSSNRQSTIHGSSLVLFQHSVEATPIKTQRIPRRWSCSNTVLKQLQ